MECFLCKILCEKPTYQAKREKIKQFTKELWLSCQTFLKARKHFNHKYQDAVLPNTWDDALIGYHSSCYKEFRVREKYMSYESDEESNNTESDSSTLCNPTIRAENASSQIPDHHTSEFTVDNSMKHASSSHADNEEGSHNIEDEDNQDHSVSVESFSNEATANNCFFCEKKIIKRKGRLVYCRRIKNKIPFLENMKSFATELNDLNMLQKIFEEINSANDSCLSYHNNCKANYYTQYRTEKNRPEINDWALKRDFHKIARDKLSHYVECEIINNMRALSLVHLKNCFSEFLGELYNVANMEFTMFSTKNLKDYLRNQFKSQISFVFISNIEFIISSRMDIETINDEELENILFEQEAQDFALKYRSHILKIKKNPLPEYIDNEVLEKGECEIPKWLQIFWTTALKGVSNKNNNRIERLSSCYSQDSIFSVTRGNIKPKKHILLGIAIKSLTGSKKIIDMLNKQGYCISYSNILELETSAAYSCLTRNVLCPSGIIPTSTLSCGVAWNNFDRFVETSSGKNTLHDTVGIIYQSTPTEAQLNIIEQVNDDALMETQNSFTPSVRNLSGRRKRSYEPEEFLNLRYAKQFRPQFRHSTTEQTDIPQALTLFENISFAWLLSHKLNIANTPMWIGYNSKIIKDDSTIEKIEYLTQINSSPTDPAVVKETMRRSMQIASECGKKYFCVTYDLAIAKIALRIQSAEEEFKNLFINYGPFHIWMSLHKAIGKFIDGSGLTNFLADSGILASGSISSFLSGKHFHRCKKIHPILSLALQILHLKSFLQQYNLDDLENIKHYLIQFNEQQNICPEFNNDECKELFEAYKLFKNETLQGKHGKTPQIFMMYTRLVEYYLMFDFSIRTADYDMFLYVLPKITNVLFSMNHHNYARYLTVYYDKLLNIENTHPGLLADYKSSFMGIRRTSKPFSRNPIDLTLEQTVNADAASRATGIINVTNSFSARQRWSITHSFRTSTISKVLEFCNMQPKDDVTKDLKKSEIIKSSQMLKMLLEIISQCTNPFSLELLEDQLYNVSTGQSVNNEVYEFLSSIETEGEKQRTNFIAEVRETPERFDKAIKKNTIINFNYNKSKKVKLDGKVKEIRIQRDIFGRLLYASLTKNIDIEKALNFPLSPIPFSLCHSDGAICKTPKSVVFEELIAKQTDNINPPEPDIHIFDGFYLLHTLKNVADTYGNISKQIFKILVYNKKEVHIIFDKYNKPSIKDFEHDLRGEDDTQYDIRKNNKRPAEFNKLLRSAHFKEKFVEFLIEDWKKDEFALLCQGKTVKLNFDQCYVYEVSNGNRMTRSIDYNLSCYQEEADTKIVYHICQFNRNYRVQVHCSDSDIPIIMLANFKFLKDNIEIVIDLSTSKKKLYLNVNEIYANLGEKLSRSLTVCHIFTGNDYNPAFYRKGKRRPFSILKKSEAFQDSFINLIDSTPDDLKISSEVFKKIEEFVCKIYSLKSTDINRGRCELFEKSYKIKSDKEEVIKKKLTRYDASNLPPCKEELLQQIKRTVFISSIWCNAHMRCPTQKKPSDYGWTIIDGKYEHNWFDGPQSPSLEELSSEPQDFDNENDDGEADDGGGLSSDDETWSTDDSGEDNE